MRRIWFPQVHVLLKKNAHGEKLLAELTLL